MSDQPQYMFSTTDYAILRGIAVHRPQGQRGYYALLQEKLVAGQVVDDAQLPPSVVRLNSTVRYRIGERQPLEHKLVLGPAKEVLGKTVSVRSLHGLALMGAREGQLVVLRHPGMPDEEVRVEAVLMQPESEEVRIRAVRAAAEVARAQSRS